MEHPARFCEGDHRPRRPRPGREDIHAPSAHETTRSANEREAFGQEIRKSQMNHDMIAQMAVEVAAARILVYCAAWQMTINANDALGYRWEP